MLSCVHQLYFSGMQPSEKFHTKINLANSLNATVLLSMHSFEPEVKQGNLLLSVKTNLKRYSMGRQDALK